LTIGPVLLVATCYAIAAPSHRLVTPESANPARDTTVDKIDSNEPLESRCRSAAKKLRASLGIDWNIIIREPFVLGGDATAEELDERYKKTVVPTARALAFSYFSETPRNPIVLLICSSDDRFRECNLRLDDQERNQYSGIYVRKHRRVIVNIASGEGTLAHELTHSLAHADFPTMPEWFEEGLASLHEECEFSTDGLHLIGNSNWRHEVAFEALERGELRLIEDVSSNRFGSPHRANIDYAYVRSLCLYLQKRGLLEQFYHACRSNAGSDPTGLRSLCQVAHAANPRAIDDAFRVWLIAQRPRGQ
jgi:hypothetical protein